MKITTVKVSKIPSNKGSPYKTDQKSPAFFDQERKNTTEEISRT